MPRRPTLSADVAPSLSTALASGRRITEQTNSGGTSTFVPVPNAPVSSLDRVPPPLASVDFNQQQAAQFCIENRTSDPGSPAVGQIWLRTDL